MDQFHNSVPIECEIGATTFRISLQQKLIHSSTRLSSSNQQQREQASSRKQHAHNRQRIVYVPTRHPTLQLTDNQTNKQHRRHRHHSNSSYVFHASYTAPNSLGGKSRPPDGTPGRTQGKTGSFRGCRLLRPSLGAALKSNMSCFFALVCIYIMSYKYGS